MDLGTILGLAKEGVQLARDVMAAWRERTPMVYVAAKATYKIFGAQSTTVAWPYREVEWPVTLLRSNGQPMVEQTEVGNRPRCTVCKVDLGIHKRLRIYTWRCPDCGWRKRTWQPVNEESAYAESVLKGMLRRGQDPGFRPWAQ